MNPARSLPVLLLTLAIAAETAEPGSDPLLEAKALDQ